MLDRACGISLVLVMTTAVVAGAQLERNVIAGGVLLPCCVVESKDAAGAFLVLKNAATGELRRVQTPPTKYRLGQVVDMNSERTRLAITPFPIAETKKTELNGNSAWTMRTWLVVSIDGRAEGKTILKSTEATRGFTGGVEVLLVDRAGNNLHQTSLRRYGVNANAERTTNWSEPVSADALSRVRSVVIHHSYEPNVRLAASVGWIKDNSQNVFRVLTCIPLGGDDKGAPGMRGPTSRNQPSASAMQCSE